MWDYAMPFWIEAILNDVPAEEHKDFKSMFG